MRSSRTAALVALCLVALHGCKKVGDQKPVPTKEPVPAPADLLVEASMPKLQGGLTSLGEYVDKVQPGMGSMMDSQTKKGLASAVDIASLDGAKDGDPVYFLILDPEKGEGGNALLVGVADEAKLRTAAKDATIKIQDGRALVGGKRAVETLAPYAFATLARKAPPAMPAAVVYVPALLAAYRDDIKTGFDAMKGQLAAMQGGEKMGRLFDLYFDAVIGLLEGSDAIEVRLESNGDLLGVDVAFVPKAGSDLAGFVAAQKPATAALLARLPASATPPSLIMAGHLELGPFRDKLRPLIAELFSSVLGVPMDDEIRAAFDAWFDEFTGDMVGSGDFGAGGMRFTQLAGVTPGGQAMEKARALFTRVIGGGPRVVEVMGTKMTISGEANAGSHDGITFMAYDAKVDLKSLPPEVAAMQQKMYGDGMRTTVAGWDDVIGISIGPDGAKAMPGLIDASRGKAPRLELGSGVTRLLEDSRARGESFAYVMNMTGILAGITGGTAAPSQGGILMAIGFQGGRAHLRIAVPAEHVTELRTAFSGSGM